MSVILLVLSFADIVLPGHPVFAFAVGFAFELLVASCVGFGLRKQDEEQWTSRHAHHASRAFIRI